MTTRREALEIIGVATGSLLLGTLAGGHAVAGAVGDVAAASYPWPYAKLDPDRCAERAYQGFVKGHCMYGSFLGIVSEYGEKMGAPYNSFPYDMMKIGAGGGGDWAVLCGALNGSMLAISLFSRDPKPLVDELFSWYQYESLPNYRPAHPRTEITVKTVAKSPLCHASVSRWCKAAKVKAFSKQRDERCAWITASVAKKTVELLNAQAGGVFQSSYPLPARVRECRTCHDKGSAMENTRGKMDCDSCHTLPAKHPEI